MAEKKQFEVPSGLLAAMDAIKNLPDLRSFKAPAIDLSHFNSIRSEQLQAFSAVRSQLAAQAERIAEFQRSVQRIALPTKLAIEQMAEAAKRMQPALEQIARLTQPSPETLRLFEQVALTDRRKRRLDRIGVLPHPSTPFAMLDTEAGDNELKEELQQHYQDEWGDISHSVQERTQYFAIDEEAKATLLEGLNAHRDGHYRAVCRLLLPEIERVTRVEFAGNKVGSLNVDAIIGKPALDLGMSETDPPGYYALGLYLRLTEHLYIRVDEANRLKMENDPVPNRHASLHGLVIYNTFWHSLNAIFITDFAFQLVTALSARRNAA